MLDNQLTRFLISQIKTGFLSLTVTPILTESGLIIQTEDGSDILADGISINVKQAYQPTKQGVNTSPTLYLYKVSDSRIGSPYRYSEWVTSQIDTESGENILTESGDSIMTDGGLSGYMQTTQRQQMATTYQLSALAAQNPADIEMLTASDLLNYAAFVLQSDDFLQALKDQNMGILRIPGSRNPYFTNDRDQFEAMPSFDFVITHKQGIVRKTPALQTVEYQILSV